MGRKWGRIGVVLVVAVVCVGVGDVCSAAPLQTPGDRELVERNDSDVSVSARTLDQ
jgi:hypothetical protein